MTRVRSTNRTSSASDNGLITVLIADDHPMVRQGLKAMLNTRDIKVVDEAATGSEAVERVRELGPDVVLMDIQMPDMDGLSATRAIKETAPGTSVIIVTAFESQEYLRDAVQSGAAGYILKGMPWESLIQAVKVVKGGASLIDSDLLAELLKEVGVGATRFFQGTDAAFESLSEREREVLQLLAEGQSNKEIAAHIGYSLGTVKNVVQRIIQKLGVSDRTQAAVLAVRACVDIG